IFLDIFRSFPIVDRTIGLYRVHERSAVFTDINRWKFRVTVFDRQQDVGEAGRTNLPTHRCLSNLVRWRNLLKPKRSFAVCNYSLREIKVNSNEVGRMLYQLQVPCSDVRGDQWIQRLRVTPQQERIEKWPEKNLIVQFGRFQIGAFDLRC